MNYKLLGIVLLFSFPQLALAQWQNAADGAVYNLGNVSIGTSGLFTKLNVHTTAPNDGIWVSGPSSNIALLVDETQGAWSGLVQPGDKLLMWKAANIDGADAGGFAIGPWSNGMTGIRIDYAGHVSIGTSNAQNYTLAVNGPAIFTKVVVKQFGAWPDYVFRPQYCLLSLDSLDRYIAEHQHLPDIPSADSVMGNGIDLGESQAQLLKKIEELTLYVINQNRTIKDLQAKVDQLSRK